MFCIMCDKPYKIRGFTYILAMLCFAQLKVKVTTDIHTDILLTEKNHCRLYLS